MGDRDQGSAEGRDNAPGRYRDEAARWAAVEARDRAADGAFFVAVRTTGIYCRPSCKSRQPLRKNVAFHESAADAVRAGFRACKRCKPELLDPAGR